MEPLKEEDPRTLEDVPRPYGGILFCLLLLNVSVLPQQEVHHVTDRFFKKKIHDE